MKDPRSLEWARKTRDDILSECSKRGLSPPLLAKRLVIPNRIWRSMTAKNDKELRITEPKYYARVYAVLDVADPTTIPPVSKGGTGGGYKERKWPNGQLQKWLKTEGEKWQRAAQAIYDSLPVIDLPSPVEVTSKVTRQTISEEEAMAGLLTAVRYVATLAGKEAAREVAHEILARTMPKSHTSSRPAEALFADMLPLIQEGDTAEIEKYVRKNPEFSRLYMFLSAMLSDNIANELQIVQRQLPSLKARK